MSRICVVVYHSRVKQLLPQAHLVAGARPPALRDTGGPHSSHWNRGYEGDIRVP